MERLITLSFRRSASVLLSFRRSASAILSFRRSGSAILSFRRSGSALLSFRRSANDWEILLIIIRISRCARNDRGLWLRFLTSFEMTAELWLRFLPLVKMTSWRSKWQEILSFRRSDSDWEILLIIIKISHFVRNDRGLWLGFLPSLEMTGCVIRISPFARNDRRSSKYQSRRLKCQESTNLFFYLRNSFMINLYISAR